jgi:hypothetical protein
VDRIAGCPILISNYKILIMVKIHFCKDCQVYQFQFNLNNTRKYEQDKHHLICKWCLKKYNLWSMSKCKSIFMLNNINFKKVKCIYIDNPKNKNKFFIFNEIEPLIIEKYESSTISTSMDKINKIKKDKTKKKDDIKNKRRNELKRVLEEHKLSYKNHGDCYSYVENSYPPINEIIENEVNKLNIIRQRKIKLANELNKESIVFDEDLPSCYNYINNIGSNKNLYDVVQECKVEHFFKMNTDYLKYLENYDPIKAKKLAAKDKILPQKRNNIIISFD